MQIHFRNTRQLRDADAHCRRLRRPVNAKNHRHPQTANSGLTASERSDSARQSTLLLSSGHEGSRAIAKRSATRRTVFFKWFSARVFKGRTEDQLRAREVSIFSSEDRENERNLRSEDAAER